MRYIIIFVFFLTSSYAKDIFKYGDFVVDNIHNLYWQDTQENTTLLKTHQGAIKYCEELSLAGFDDWYLPTVEQYKFIIDKSKKDIPKIDSSFVYIVNDDYWTKDSRWQNFYRYGYYVLFKSGNIYYQNKKYPKYVRCIRENK